MKRTTIFLSLSLLLATSCTASVPPPPATLDAELRNPLFAEQFWTERLEWVVSVIQGAEYEGAKANYLEAMRLDALLKSQEAAKKRGEGLFGAFVPVRDEVEGFTLFIGDKVYFSPYFLARGGADTRVYLTHAIDPRDVTFPDQTSVDLGPLQSLLGPQEYTVPTDAPAQGLRTVVLWERTLQRIIGFAQLTQRQ